MFLKVSRLIVRRSPAQEFCDAGLVSINGAPAKSGKEVKVGDELTIQRRNRKTVVRIDVVPDKKQLSKGAAGELFSVISDEQINLA